jgi:hypothetical protein
MYTAYLVITLVFALMVTYSGIGKIRRDPLQVKVVHETVGVPLKYFPLLAACEFAGAVGLVVGIWWPLAGIASGIGLVSISWEPSCPICRSAISKALGPPCSCWCLPQERSRFGL